MKKYYLFIGLIWGVFVKSNAQSDSTLALKQFISLLNKGYKSDNAIQFNCVYDVSVLDSNQRILTNASFQSNAKTYKNLSRSIIENKVIQINTDILSLTVLSDKKILLLDSSKENNFTQFNSAQFARFVQHHHATVNFLNESKNTNVQGFEISHPGLIGGKCIIHMDPTTGFILDFFIQVKQTDFYNQISYQQIEMKASDYQLIPYRAEDFSINEFLKGKESSYEPADAFRSFRLIDNRIKPVFSKKP